MNTELPKYIHGNQENLPKTLASRVSYIRNIRRLHIAELSQQSRVSVELLEDIEAGIETWLPTSIRQRIARVLKVDPNILEEVEIKIINKDVFPKNPPFELLERLQDEILSGNKDLKCPQCQSPLKTWIQEGLDLNGISVKSAKAHCTVCIFQLRQ